LYFCPANFAGVKLREIGNFIEELRYLDRMGIKNLCFRDMLFSGNKRHTVELCEAIIKERLQFDWYCETRVDTVDGTILEIMKKAGCFLVWFGVESGDNSILKSSEKKIDIATIKDTFKACKEIGIQTGAYVIFGLPGDTEESILKTIDFLIFNHFLIFLHLLNYRQFASFIFFLKFLLLICEIFEQSR
jgi:radical SAM superfamily enzyme YgiQ (UPF0313 family)